MNIIKINIKCQLQKVELMECLTFVNYFSLIISCNYPEALWSMHRYYPHFINEETGQVI